LKQRVPSVAIVSTGVIAITVIADAAAAAAAVSVRGMSAMICD